jgi:ribosome-associated protein
MVSISHTTPRPASSRPPAEEVLARTCAGAASDKKAEEVVTLDLRGISTFTDFFVICSGGSEPQIKAISDGIQEKMQEQHGIKPLRVDGFPLSQWVVVDFGSVLVHIFHASKRHHYALEDLWNDAPRLPAPGT